MDWLKEIVARVNSAPDFVSSPEGRCAAENAHRKCEYHIDLIGCLLDEVERLRKELADKNSPSPP